MKYLYSQLDPEWANQKVGKSGKNLGQIGCLLTDIAIIITDLMGEENTPEELLLWMNINNGFDAQGNLKWETLLKYPIDKIGFHQGKAGAGETQYEIYAVWAGRIKHWILKDGDKWIDPLKGAYISKNYYAFQGDVRLLAGKKLQPIMNYEKKIIQNQEKDTPEAGEFSLVKDGKRRRITKERAGLASLDAQKSKREIVGVNSAVYHSIPKGLDF